MVTHVFKVGKRGFIWTPHHIRNSILVAVSRCDAGSVRAGVCLFVLNVEQEAAMGPVSVWPSSVDPDCPCPRSAQRPARPATRAAVPVRGVMTLTVSLTDSGWWWWWCQPQLMPPQPRLTPGWVDDTPSGDTRRGQRVGARHPRPATSNRC